MTERRGGLAAGGAGVGTVAGMGAYAGRQVARLREGLAACDAGEGRSPEWVRMCTVRVLDLEKAWPQVVQHEQSRTQVGPAVCECVSV